MHWNARGRRNSWEGFADELPSSSPIADHCVAIVRGAGDGRDMMRKRFVAGFGARERVTSIVMGE